MTKFFQERFFYISLLDYSVCLTHHGLQPGSGWNDPGLWKILPEVTSGYRRKLWVLELDVEVLLKR